jgi:RNA polymerase sigma factor (sigma-70 family)
MQSMMQARAAITNTNDASEAFGNTDWWVVQQAGRIGQRETDPARSRIYQAYWKPLFGYVLHAGYEWHDAQDLTQEFFSRVLKHNSLRTASQERGKFRSFLLTLLKRFLADQRDRTRCQKRGQGARVISLDEGDTEFRRRIEPISELDPEQICERQWVESLLRNVLAQLEQEYVSHGKALIFQGVKALVTGDHEVSCAQVAAELNLTEANVRVTVHRLRRRLRELLSDAGVGSGISRARVKQELLDVYIAKNDGYRFRAATSRL